MEKIKILFLDIDGVLCIYDNILSLQALNIEARDLYGFYFDSRCVRWLEYIIKSTNCRIVISSSWKNMGLYRLQTMWEMRDLPGEIFDITPSHISLHTSNVYGSLKPECQRGLEIQEWLDKSQWTRYCIVDDNDNMLPDHNFVQTDYRIGLDFETANKIIKILNKM